MITSQKIPRGYPGNHQKPRPFEEFIQKHDLRNRPYAHLAVLGNQIRRLRIFCPEATNHGNLYPFAVRSRDSIRGQTKLSSPIQNAQGSRRATRRCDNIRTDSLGGWQ